MLSCPDSMAVILAYVWLHKNLNTYVAMLLYRSGDFASRGQSILWGQQFYSDIPHCVLICPQARVGTGTELPEAKNVPDSTENTRQWSWLMSRGKLRTNNTWPLTSSRLISDTKIKICFTMVLFFGRSLTLTSQLYCHCLLFANFKYEVIEFLC